MFVVNFSDKIEFIFTEKQIKYIPYFKTLIESDFKTNFQINHASMGFNFLHTYATLDEIDIIDPQDKYLFVLKQWDFFCYDKLKELVEKKYGFRTDVSENNICKQIKCSLTYVGTFNFYNTYWASIPTIIEIIYEPPLYNTDSDINNIYIERYKQKMEEYYLKLFDDMFLFKFQEEFKKYNKDKGKYGARKLSVFGILSKIKPKYVIRLNMLLD